MQEIIFVTSNRHKYNEAKKIMEEFGIKIKWRKLKLDEPRGEVKEIARKCAKEAFEKIKKPLFVEDTGLFIPALNGFPGEFSSWVYKKLGLENFLKITGGKEAYFLTVIAFTDGKKIKVFEGKLEGKISKRIKGSSGFGYDPVFIPKGYKKTLAQLGEAKNLISHRRRALEKLARYIRGRSLTW